jgi:alkylation response protein AidB-like acyl-CoA dehydrogenase
VVLAANLVGPENAGWRIITSQLNHERIALAASRTWISERLREVVERAAGGCPCDRRRHQGGRADGASSPAHLRAMAKSAYAGYQATRYDDTGRLLPALASSFPTARDRVSSVPVGALPMLSRG